MADRHRLWGLGVPRGAVVDRHGRPLRIEFIEGNTITRLYFMRLRRLAGEAMQHGKVTEELAKTRQQHVPTFTHFLDIPILFVIVALGAIRPNTWALFAVGIVLAVVAATVLTLLIPRLYPFEPARSAELK